MNKYLDILPQPIPQRIRSLPVQNGYPVPWFVAKIGDKYDFRISDSRKFAIAIKHRRCWICGEKLGSYLAFPIGPMCAINRTISEPPSHTECAKWSIKACPFLAQRQDTRRDTNLPDNIKQPGGVAIARQPGATGLWITNKYDVWNVENGIIFKLGDPLEVLWFCEGREATREEVLKSIETGYPILLEAAQQESKFAVSKLEAMKQEALTLIPK